MTIWWDDMAAGDLKLVRRHVYDFVYALEWLGRGTAVAAERRRGRLGAVGNIVLADLFPEESADACLGISGPFSE